MIYRSKKKYCIFSKFTLVQKNTLSHPNGLKSYRIECPKVKVKSCGVVGYVNAVKPGKVNKSEMVLSGLSALIAPCLVFHQTSKLLRWSSILSVAKYIVFAKHFLKYYGIKKKISNEKLISRNSAKNDSCLKKVSTKSPN